MSFGEGLHDQVPDSSRSPANEPVVAGRVRPKALRQVAPWCALPQYPEDAVEDTSVVDPRHAARLVRKERSDGSPLKVRKCISHDSRLRFGSLNHACPRVRNVEFQVRDGPDSGHAADMSNSMRMTHIGLTLAYPETTHPRDAASNAPPRPSDIFLVSCQLEMLAQAGVDLIDSPFGRRYVPQRVQRDEIVNRAVIANSIDDDARILHLLCIRLTLVA